MILTDDNIDKKTAKYWCLLSDKQLESALREVVKKANSSFKQKNSSSKKKKEVDESVLGAAAAEVALEVVAAGVSNYLDTTERTKWKEAVDDIKNDAYLETLDLKHELGRLDDDEFYKLVQASYVVRNYGQSAEKNSAADRALGRGYERYDTSAQATNADAMGKSAWKTSPIEDMKKAGFGSWSGDHTHEDTKAVEAAFELLSQYTPTQVIAATAVDMSVDKSLMFNKEPALDNPLLPKKNSGSEDKAPPLAVSDDGSFTNGGVDYSKQVISGIKDSLETGKLSAKVEDGHILLANGPSGEHGELVAAQAANAQTEKALEDSPSIKSSSKAVAWIAGAAAAAVAVPYLWKRLKQLADYMKSGKALAKCQFQCTENGQEYVFEYDLKQMQWKLKFAGSTALKYTPYPSDDEVKSFVQTKFAKKFVDEVESQLKSLYSAKDKKILFKAVQAAGKEGSDLIKYLFDNQKAIESSLYGIKKHKIWESVRKFRKWA